MVYGVIITLFKVEFNFIVYPERCRLLCVQYMHVTTLQRHVSGYCVVSQ